MDEFGSEYLERIKKDDPSHYELATFFLAQMNKSDKIVKNMMYIQSAFLLPVYLVVFNYIFRS